MPSSSHTLPLARNRKKKKDDAAFSKKKARHMESFVATFVANAKKALGKSGCAGAPPSAPTAGKEGASPGSPRRASSATLGYPLAWRGFRDFCYCMKGYTFAATASRELAEMVDQFLLTLQVESWSAAMSSCEKGK